MLICLMSHYSYLNIYKNVFQPSVLRTNINVIHSLRLINPNTELLLNFVELFTAPSYVS